MKNTNTWHKTAFEPAFAMPAHAAASAYARTQTCGTAAVVTGAPMGAVRLEAVRVKGSIPGSPAWSPPTS